MNLVDSSGWIEYFIDGPNADIFSKPLADVNNLIVSTISVFEVYKVVLRERGEDAALQVIALLQKGTVVDVTSKIAIQAAKVSYDKKIPMADSFILTTAQMYEATIWTQDEDLKGIPGVKYIPKLL